MRTRLTAATLAAAALLALTACEGTEATSSSKPDTTSQNTNDQPKTDTDASPDTEADATDDNGDSVDAAETATLPDLVGQDLQAAQDEAQAAGFYVLDDQDASGQNRLQVMDRNWVVCSQEPSAGTHPTDTKVVLFAVKDGESC
ncbi:MULTISPECIES: PASTA domain-containing protein [unclassified Streptomyces]|uniref:PASTA domain-containing protein n=1 Tax=unclassified Streptomyces TaxID=2593676 RepID=UPI0033A448C3